jgi:hypothetical protein
VRRTILLSSPVVARQQSKADRGQYLAKLRDLLRRGDGDLFEITDDSRLPGLGRVEGIKRQDGQWVVVTARGLISSAP